MRATKLPSGKWRARAYNKITGERPSFTAESKKEAERLARQYQYQAEHATVESATFGVALTEHLANRKNILSPTTYTSYLAYQRKYYDALNDVQIGRITSDILQAWVNDIAVGRSPKTVSNIYGLASAVLRSRMPQKRFSVVLPKVGKAKLNLPSEGQIRSLMAVAEGTDLCVPIYLAAFCAMRRGEIVALKDSAIDFGARKITISENIVKNEQNKWVTKRTKNEDDRVIQVPELVIDKIRQYGLFAHNADWITKEFGRMLKDNGIAPFRFHDLRHYCAAQMLANGIPIAVVQEYGGWRDQDVLLKIYDYVIAEVREKSMANWNEFCKNWTRFAHEP